MKRNFLISLTFIAFLAIGLVVFSNYPEITEKVYSKGIYPYIGVFLRMLFCKIPFSVGDIFYTFIGFFPIYYVIKNRKKMLKNVGILLSRVVLFLSTMVFLFYFLWGFNYFRKPLSTSLDWDIQYSEADLKQVTEKLIVQANELHHLLVKNDTLAVENPFSVKEIYEKTGQGYDQIAKYFPEFQLYTYSEKSSLYSEILTYMGYSGYLNPFTGEAQVNSLVQEYQMPVTCAHEMAHQLGYASEKEANFIGFLATYHHPQEYFRYSASLFALRYCLREIQKLDTDLYKEYLGKIKKGILLNYKKATDFWLKYQNPMEDVFKKSYDTFLKVNKQEGGIKNYDYVTGLIIAYLREK
ncbi:MAG: DUF3810 domain-containing protein [Capnocytophaga sp.]|nr:DUF3810 domain-containing protein [Capnocytophaga sp.]